MIVNALTYVEGENPTNKPTDFAQWAKVYNKMVIHTSGSSPEQIIREHRKSDPDNILKGKLENYTPFTKGAINKAIDKAARVIIDSSYTVESEALDDYLNEPVKVGNVELKESLDFNSFFLNYVWKITVDDPNGVLVTMPLFPEDHELVESFENIEPFNDGFRLIEPNFNQVLNSNVDIEVRIIRYCDIRYISDSVFTWEAGEWVYHIKDETVKSAPYYFIVDREDFFIYVPIDDKDDVIEYSLVPYYNHAIGEVPISVLGGNLVSTKDDTYYDSFFAPYAEWGHKAIKRYADLDTIIDINGYPVKILESSPCVTCEGRKHITEEGKTKQCSTCNGSGVIYDISPSSVFKKKDKTYSDTEGEKFLPIEWAEAPTGQMEFLSQHIRELMDNAEKSINILFNDGANSSGKAMDIRRDDAHNMLFKISENMFRIIEDHLTFVNALLFRNNEPDFMIVKPMEFGIKTFDDLLNERKQLQGSNTAMIVEVEKKIAKQRFPGNERIGRIIDLQSQYDILYGMSPQEVAQLRASGGVDDKDVKIHSNIYKELARIEDLDRPDSEIFSELDTIFLRFDNQVIPLT